MDSHSCKNIDGSDQGMAKSGTVFGKLRRQDPRCQPLLKKQAKRRFHAARPYQERVANMAQARQEVVNALKLHRAAMKAREQLQYRLTSLPLSPVPSSALHLPEEEPYRVVQYGKSPLDSFLKSKISNKFEAISSMESSPRMHSNHHGLRSTSTSTIVNTTLNSFAHTIFSPLSSAWPCSKPMSLSSPEVPKLSGIQMESSATLHLAMNAKEIDEIQLIGAQHDMEWNDKLNLSASLWWCHLLQKMEMGSREQEGKVEGAGDMLGFPDASARISHWFSANEELSGNSSDFCWFFDEHLPCVTAEEIEGTGDSQLFPY